MSAVGDRVKTLGDIVEQAGFFLAPDVTYDSIAVEKVLRAPRAAEALTAIRELFVAAPDFEPATLERIVRGYADGKGLKLGEAVQPIRVAVTGRTASPGIFEVLSVLGRERTLRAHRGGPGALRVRRQGESSNGRTADSGSASGGSTPPSPTIRSGAIV